MTNLKIGDYIKYFNDELFDYAFTRNKSYKIIDIIVNSIYILDDNNIKKFAPLHRFIKINLLSNKIRKLKRLLK
jgi:hypothetical protein